MDRICSYLLLGFIPSSRGSGKDLRSMGVIQQSAAGLKVLIITVAKEEQNPVVSRGQTA
jgi:hypothetical protein